MTTMTIGKVAKVAGLGVETVRFYERQLGAVKRPRTKNLINPAYALLERGGVALPQSLPGFLAQQVVDDAGVGQVRRPDVLLMDGLAPKRVVHREARPLRADLREVVALGPELLLDEGGLALQCRGLGAGELMHPGGLVVLGEGAGGHVGCVSLAAHGSQCANGRPKPAGAL